MSSRLIESLTLKETASLIAALGAQQSVLLLSAPGVGKSEMVRRVAADHGLECRSLLGTQIAPEDVSGVPRIIGERTVFCPPRVLLPENAAPFCLFLDELPATAPDVQKAFYSLLLERRVGEFGLPPGSWVVAAGNRMEDRALVRAMSSALVNRVLLINVRVDVRDWLIWGQTHGVRQDVLSFITIFPQALMRPVPAEALPFSTPRSWTLLAQAIDLLEAAGCASAAMVRALAFGRVSAEDAAVFAAMYEERTDSFLPLEAYFDNPRKLPEALSTLWLIVASLRARVAAGSLTASPEQVRALLDRLPAEARSALFLDLVPQWAALGASDVLLEDFRAATGLR